MSTGVHITDYLSNIKVELYISHFNSVGTDWVDLDFTPDYSKFYYIVDGEGWLKIGNKEYYPQPGQLFLLPEGVEQSYSYTNEQHTFKKYWCHFSVKVEELNLFHVLELPIFCTIDANHREQISSIFQEMITYEATDAVYGKLLAKAKLIELISHFLMNIDSNLIQLKNVQSIEKLSNVLAYIDQHIEREITIKDLAEVACLHPNYFIRFFKQQIGVPPIQYIVHKKIDIAKERLTNSSATIYEIAQHVGFQDMFHFSKQFKKIAGLTPTQYRKDNQ